MTLTEISRAMIENCEFDPLAPIEDDLEDHDEPFELNENYKAMGKLYFYMYRVRRISEALDLRS